MTTGKFECQFCATRLAVEREMSGSDVECPGCHRTITIPRTFLLAGDELGSFIIERLLGSGGMGDVFLATQITLQRKVALKVLPQGLTLDKSSLDEFLHEVRMTARIEHPNIVTAFEAGEDNGVYYLAMTFVDGRNLEQCLAEEGPMAEHKALAVISKVAQALAHAWDKERILHRDIKPANIMLDQSGETKLLDLGIAVSHLDHRGQAGTERHIEGTPDYMSPEQVRGSTELDCRADIYSLGASLYHLVTGTPPFHGADVMAVMQAHVDQELVSPRTRNAAVSVACSTLIMTMMAKNAHDRFANWEQTISAIEAARKPSPAAMPDAKPAARPSRDGKRRTPPPTNAKSAPKKGAQARASKNKKRLKPSRGAARAAYRPPVESPLSSPLVVTLLIIAGIVFVAVVLSMA